jgi:hypothetical protein
MQGEQRAFLLGCGCRSKIWCDQKHFLEPCKPKSWVQGFWDVIM